MEQGPGHSARRDLVLLRGGQWNRENCLDYRGWIQKMHLTRRAQPRPNPQVGVTEIGQLRAKEGRGSVRRAEWMIRAELRSCPQSRSMLAQGVKGRRLQVQRESIDPELQRESIDSEL